jgi:hypothetical protein
MSKTKKLVAATLAVVALAAVPATSLALSNGDQGVRVACQGGSGGGCTT